MLVSPRTTKRHYFDLYKDRVAIEIELSNRELLYRDYIRFLLAEADDRLDVGIIVLLDAVQHRKVHACSGERCATLEAAVERAGILGDRDKFTAGCRRPGRLGGGRTADYRPCLAAHPLRWWHRRPRPAHHRGPGPGP